MITFDNLKHTLFLFLFLPVLCFSQNSPKVSTIDIEHFWMAFDKLSSASSKEDSINIIQTDYFDKGSTELKKIIKLKSFTAEEYVKRIGLYPNFWLSVRPITENINKSTDEITDVLDQLSKQMSGFKYPDVYFIIGPMRTGGTVTKTAIIIGTELSAADATVVTSELGSWHKSVIGNTGGIKAMIAHEAIHVQQSGIPFWEIFRLIKHKRLSLLNMSILEGSADFFTATFLNLNINSKIHDYAKPKECELSREFITAIETAPFDYKDWLYTGMSATDRPADLGYYIGYRIAEEFYNNSADKKKAMKKILKRGRYKYIYKRSDYQKASCEQ